MNTLNRYIARDFLITFLFTITIVTFVMTVGGLVKAIDVMSQGVSGMLVLRFFLTNIPFMLMFSLPMSVLAATLLVFGRLSADGELTAMKASGISMWKVAAPVILLSIVLSVLCFIISANIAPKANYARRTMQRELGVETPLSLLQEGTWVNFPGLRINIARKRGLRLDDVLVFAIDEDSRQVEAKVRAEYGVISTNVGPGLIQLDLYEARVDEPGKDYINMDHLVRTVDVSSLRSRKPKPKLLDLDLRQLLDGMADVEAFEPGLDEGEYRKLHAALVVEANKRVTLALSCFAFTLLAIPLGLKSRRRESSIGIALSLLLAFFFYFFTILAEAMAKRPETMPELIVWFPVLAMEAVGAFLIWRNR